MRKRLPLFTFGAEALIEEPQPFGSFRPGFLNIGDQSRQCLPRKALSAKAVIQKPKPLSCLRIDSRPRLHFAGDGCDFGYLPGQRLALLTVGLNACIQ